MDGGPDQLWKHNCLKIIKKKKKKNAGYSPLSQIWLTMQSSIPLKYMYCTETLEVYTIQKGACTTQH